MEQGPADFVDSRPRHVLWIAVVTGFVLSFTLAALLFTLRMTALDADWYRDSIEDNRAYDRLYDDVLTDPKVARETRALLAGLPIDQSLVAANVRFVLPPETLRAIIDRTLDGMVDYLRGEQSTFDPIYSLQPFFDNIRKLAHHYFSDAVVNLHPLQARNLDEFARDLTQFANDLGAGRRPVSLPTIPFTTEQVDQLTELLLKPIAPDRRDEVQLPVANALAAGDLSTALATVAPEYGRDHTERFVVDLKQNAHGTHLRVDETLSGADDTTIVINMSRIRFLTGTVLPAALVGSLAVGIGCLVLLGRLARRSGRGAAVTRAATVVATGVTLIVVYAIARLIIGDPFHGLFGNSSVPPELHRLLADIAGSLFSGLDRTFVGLVLLPVVVALGVIVYVLVVPRVAVRAKMASPRTLITTDVVVAAAVAVILAAVIVPLAVGGGPRLCNGHAELCDRPYDDVAFVESHNAMSASALGWLGANQDVPMLDQLDYGVRVLHIDTRYWETPAVTAKFAASLPPAQAAIVLRAVAGANPERPGVWLCHALCRLGATKLLPALRGIKGWLDAHPNEVLTLDLEDRASARDTVRLFRRAGLDRYAFTPGDPNEGWPTLGEMIDSGKRLVVFAERHGGAPKWFAKLYRYAMETPYTFRSPAAFSCRANRGGKDKRLFVMNHFITRAAPSRGDAGVVNARATVVDRARRCAAKRGRSPNFVNVDFSTVGDLRGAVNMLNGVAR